MKFLIGIKGYAIAFAGLLLAVLTFGASQRRKGRKQEREKNVKKRLEAEAKTHERINNAEISDSADAARSWLSDRMHNPDK